jgi:hypothetical protein
VNVGEAVAALDALENLRDPETQHSAADAILLASVHPTVEEAYRRVVQRTGRWWFA